MVTTFEARWKIANRRGYVILYCGRQAGSGRGCGMRLGHVMGGHVFPPRGKHFHEEEDGVYRIGAAVSRPHHADRTGKRWPQSGAYPKKPATIICHRPGCGARNVVA
jgi:hypothetical protein